MCRDGKKWFSVETGRRNGPLVWGSDPPPPAWPYLAVVLDAILCLSKTNPTTDEKEPAATTLHAIVALVFCSASILALLLGSGPALWDFHLCCRPEWPECYRVRVECVTGLLPSFGRFETGHEAWDGDSAEGRLKRKRPVAVGSPPQWSAAATAGWKIWRRRRAEAAGCSDRVIRETIKIRYARQRVHCPCCWGVRRPAPYQLLCPEAKRKH